MRKEDIPIFRSLDPIQSAAIIAYGEARGEQPAGIAGVVSVIFHRAKLGYFGGHTINEVCFKQTFVKRKDGNFIDRAQFSCINSDDPNYKLLLGIVKNFDEALKENFKLCECYEIAEAIISGDKEPNIIASFYKVKGTSASWESSMEKVGVIGNHEFFIEPKDPFKKV